MHKKGHTFSWRDFRLFTQKLLFPCVNLYNSFISFSVTIIHKTSFTIPPPFPGSTLSQVYLNRISCDVVGFQDVGRCLAVTDDLSCDQLFHDFVSTTVDRLNSSIHIGFCNRVLPHVAPASMELNTLISYSVL